MTDSPSGAKRQAAIGFGSVVGPRGARQLVLDLRVGVGHGEDDRPGGHAGDHLGGVGALRRQAHGHVRAGHGFQPERAAPSVQARQGLQELGVDLLQLFEDLYPVFLAEIEIEQGKVGFKELEAHALKLGEVTTNESGRQEYLENLINQFI